MADRRAGKSVVFEPTGPYHRALERALDAAGAPIVKINPRQARRFAEAAGKLVKTDRVDAAMLARMGEVLGLEPRPCVSQTIAELKEPHLARAALIKDRTAAKNRANAITLALLEKQNKNRRGEIDVKREEIDAAIEKLILDNAKLSRRFEILLSIPGVSKITAFALPIEMPELETSKANRPQASLASRPCKDNPAPGKATHTFAAAGLSFAKPFICRRSSLAGSTKSRAHYQKLVEARKPAMVAITAVMRKLIVLANALLRNNRTWAENAQSWPGKFGQ
jgi:transposase